VEEINGDWWVQDLASVGDITTHLNEMNIKLRGNQVVASMYDSQKTLQTKIFSFMAQKRKI
jgi:hypothetical protein